MAEKKFLAYVENLEPINTKLDTVVSDITTLKSTTSNIDTITKDTNAKVTDMQTKVNGIDGNVDAINSTTASMASTVNAINNTVTEIKDNPSGGEKWVYSGKTGTEKTLINNVDFLENGEITLAAETDDYENAAYVVGFFVPKVSGIHTITITADTLNTTENVYIGVASYNEIFFAITNHNILRTAEQNKNLDKANEQFGFWDNTDIYGAIDGIAFGKRLLHSHLNGDRFSSGDATHTMTKYCTKDEPVYILAANNETTEITLWECTVTVKYRETEPYE